MIRLVNPSGPASDKKKFRELLLTHSAISATKNA